MEGNLQKSPQLAYSIDKGEAKYVSGLSTILVATIQEAKDRISQIEYIFCRQIFPNFQSTSKSLQKLYSEARKAAEDAWKEKEKELLLQIEKLQLEMQQSIEENQSLKKEKAKFVNFKFSTPDTVYELQEELKRMTREVAEGQELRQNLLKILESKDSVIFNNEKMLKEHIEKNNVLVKKQGSLQLELEKLRCELMKKSKEVDGGMELENKLLQLVQSKASCIMDKEKQLRGHEQKEDELLARLKSLEQRIDGLQGELREKTEEVEKVKESKETLLKKIESQASNMLKLEELLSDYESKEKLLTEKLVSSETNVDGLQKELRKKTDELAEGRKLQDNLLQKIDLSDLEMLKTGQHLEELDKEKKLLLDKLKGLEEKVDNLQVKLREKSNESLHGMELHGKLLHQIEVKDSELASERKKVRDMTAAFKSLKSQYNYLCKKFGLTAENMLQNRTEARNDSSRDYQNQLASPDCENKRQVDCAVACEMTKEMIEQEKVEDHRGDRSIQRLSSSTGANTSFPIAPKSPTNGKPGPLAGSKRSASYWRDTRSHEKRGGPDPHDDFLDTPLENIRGNLKKAVKEEVQHPPGPVLEDMNCNSSDDETQDMNVGPGPRKQQMPAWKAGAKAFKYVEPVRKKAERENLKGIECKDCKKFYDAVIPCGGEKETDGNKQGLRCEHHDGVSRHRYRYAPPLTPEGFWNIGFESEM